MQEDFRAPSADIFDEKKHKTSTKFIEQYRKVRIEHRRRMSGIRDGMAQNIAEIDPVSGKPYRVLVYDTDQARLQGLSQSLQNIFELTLTGTSDDACLGLSTSDYNLCIARITRISRVAELIQRMRRERIVTPIVMIIPASIDQEDPFYQNELNDCLELGAVGYFIEGIDREMFREKLKKIVLYNAATIKVAAKMLDDPIPCQLASNVSTAIPGRAASIRKRIGLTSKSSVIDMKLHIAGRRADAEKKLACTHSAMGHGLELSQSEPRWCSVRHLVVHSPTKMGKKRSKYSDPATVQRRIQRTEYQKVIRPTTRTFFEDPLLGKCVVIDPSALSSVQDSYVSRGFKKYRMELYPEALELFEKAIHSEKQLHLATFLRAVVLHLLGNHICAEKEFTKCIKKNLKMHEAYYNRCITRLAMGKDARAVNDIRKAVKLHPTDTLYMKTYALILRRLGKFEDAQDEYIKLLDPTTSATAVTSDSLHAELEKHKLTEGIYAHMFSATEELESALQTSPMNRTSDMVQVLASRLAQIQAFNVFSRTALENCAQAIEYIHLESGQNASRPMKNPTGIYVVLSGQLSGRQKVELIGKCSITVCRFETDDVFGVFGTSLPRVDELRCDVAVSLLALSETQFNSILKPEWIDQKQDCFVVLRQLHIFNCLSDHDIAHLVNVSTTQTFKEGQSVVVQGKTVENIYIRRKGVCSTYQQVESKVALELGLRRCSTAVCKTKYRPHHHRTDLFKPLKDNGDPEQTKKENLGKIVLPRQKNHTARQVWTLHEANDPNQLLLSTHAAADVFGEAAMQPPYKNFAKA